MKQAIALRHIHFEDAGTRDAPLKEHGYQLRYASELAQAGIDPRDLRIESARTGERLRLAAHAVMSRWLRAQDAVLAGSV
jgi:hypothetical protein